MGGHDDRDAVAVDAAPCHLPVHVWDRAHEPLLLLLPLLHHRRPDPHRLPRGDWISGTLTVRLRRHSDLEARTCPLEEFLYLIHR